MAKNQGKWEKTSNPAQMWLQECQRRREVIAYKQRVIDAMRGAARPQEKPQEQSQ